MEDRIFLHVRCKDGKSQSLRRINSVSQAESEFRRYQARLISAMGMPGANPDLTEDWIISLSYKVEDSFGKEI